MAKNSKGFCLFYDWMESLDELDPADAYAVIRAISRYNETGDDPTAGFKGALKAFVLNLYQQIRRAEEASAAKAEGARITNEKRANAERTHSERIANAHPADVNATDTNTNTITDTDTIDTPSNEGVAPAPARKSRVEFKPPTLEEVTAYCRERNSTVDPKVFYDYFSEGGWKDSEGKPVRNWKQKLITWESKDRERGKERPKQSESATSSFDTDDFFDAAMKRTYADDPPTDPLVGELKAVYMTGVGA